MNWLRADVKQIAQYQNGRLELQEVPAPTMPPGGVLVQVTHSVISVATERMKVEQAKMNLLQKAMARPDQVKKVLDTAKNLGWKSALEKVRNRLESPSPLGYSASGIVVEVDSANNRFKVGDRVACGGAECAFHAEMIAVPDFLAARVPPGVPGWQASYTTLCSIALQAVRQAEPSLGDRVMVLGQGLVGLLVTNFLQRSGARVMAVDLNSARRPYCEAVGAERFVAPGAQNLADEVRQWTDGFGVDIVVICTATSSNSPVEQAAEALRDRGRVVDVGITKLDLPWKMFYEKELDIRFSRSYGPGRYDPSYEWGGNDYPIGYVRWTEQRNFEACLHLMSRGELALEAITTRRVPFGEALGVYADLLNDGSKDIGVVLEYPSKDSDRSAEPSFHAARKDQTRQGRRVAKPVAAMDVVGAGNFARTMLLPHLQGKLGFGTVVNQTALSANHAKTKFGFSNAETDASPVLRAPTGNAVLIATRHHQHAKFVIEALSQGKHVFVEKPLCLTMEELHALDGAVAASSGTVQVGFNRRFAPATAEIKRALAGSPGPKTASYRVVPGKLDPHHWYANLAESGGRVLGEACHFLDLFCFLFESKPVRVSAQTTWPVEGRLPFPDSVTAQVEFEDGSSGQLVYSAEGDPAYPKETLTVFGAGVVAETVNFQELTIHRGRKQRSSTYASKGHAEQMAAWLAFLSGAAEHPLSYEQSRRSMALTFGVLDSIRNGGSVKLEL